MDHTVLEKVHTKVTHLKATYKVEVTPQAVLILGECFTAIENDPHQSWEKQVDLKRFLSDMLDTLPSTLASFAKEHKLKKISSFDLLHGMTKIIDHMCPFLKPPP